jgi:hypothetical protein
MFEATRGDRQGNAARMIELRSILGLTPGELAAELNVSLYLVRRWETYGPPVHGPGMMAIERLERLICQRNSDDASPVGPV